MARIRSIHPGFFTDENLVSVSIAARVLFLGIGVEADDKGIFEWKPLQLKMRIFPADNFDVLSLLLELEAVNAVQKYEINGRHYGAIRNFRKFQRPKTPNSMHPITENISSYVGLIPEKEETSEFEVLPFPPKGEKSPQMEDGGDKMEDEGGNKKEDNPPDLSEAVSTWNEMAEVTKLPKIQRLTEPRTKALKARLAEAGGIEGWRLAISKVRDSPFLRGENDRGWKADFDFVLHPKKFTKLMEGSYDSTRNTSKSSIVDLVYEALQPADHES